MSALSSSNRPPPLSIPNPITTFGEEESKQPGSSKGFDSWEKMREALPSDLSTNARETLSPYPKPPIIPPRRIPREKVKEQASLQKNFVDMARYRRAASRVLEGLQSSKSPAVSDHFVRSISEVFRKKYQKWYFKTGCCLRKKKFSPLGQGSFGSVFRLVHKKAQYAIKVIGHKFKDSYISQRERLLVTKVPPHPNLVRTLFTTEVELLPYRPKRLVHVMEYLSGGDLSSLLEEKVTSFRIAKKELAKARQGDPKALKSLRSMLENYQHLIQDLSKALLHLQSHGLVHRDIKPSNIMTEACADRASGISYKLADMGFVRSLRTNSGLMEAEDAQMASSTRHLQLSPKRGTPDYMSPSMHYNPVYGNEVDSYSLGMTLVHLLRGSHAHWDFPSQIFAGEGECPLLVDFINKCLHHEYTYVNGEVRVSASFEAKDMLNHPFLKRSPAELAQSCL